MIPEWEVFAKPRSFIKRHRLRYIYVNLKTIHNLALLEDAKQYTIADQMALFATFSNLPPKGFLLKGERVTKYNFPQRSDEPEITFYDEKLFLLCVETAMEELQEETKND